MTGEPTDADLLRAARRRPDAFVEVCERHVDALRRWLRRETRDDDVAAELVAETLAAAWSSRKRFRHPGSGSARPWLFGIARNLLLRYWQQGAVERRARQRLAFRLDVAAADPYDEVERRVAASATSDRLRNGLDALPREQREALTLRVVDEIDFDEIASELAIAPTTARTRVFRALTALRTRFEGERR